MEQWNFCRKKLLGILFGDMYIIRCLILCTMIYSFKLSKKLYWQFLSYFQELIRLQDEIKIKIKIKINIKIKIAIIIINFIMIANFNFIKIIMILFLMMTVIILIMISIFRMAFLFLLKLYAIFLKIEGTAQNFYDPLSFFF